MLLSSATDIQAATKTYEAKQAARERRRESYQTNKSYRERVKGGNRKAARKYYGLAPKPLDDPSRLGQGIERLASFGVLRTVVVTNPEGKAEPKEIISFTSTELAAALGKPKYRFYEWQRKGKFPRPLNQTFVPWAGRHRSVYTYEQAFLLCSILAEHTKEKAYLLDEDQETIVKLYQVIH